MKLYINIWGKKGKTFITEHDLCYGDEDAAIEAYHQQYFEKYPYNKTFVLEDGKYSEINLEEIIEENKLEEERLEREERRYFSPEMIPRMQHGRCV
jgi:hypothetical protein